MEYSIDREKVIKGLESCIANNCRDCPYPCYCEYADDWPHELYKDTLELLKAQEAVEPSFKQGEDGIFVWCCGSCGAYMYHIYDGIDKAKEYAKFCRQCGRMVKWDA